MDLAVVVSHIILAAALGGEAVPFATVAESFRSAHNLAGVDASALQGVLDHDYLVGKLGLCEIRYPRGQADTKRANDLIAILNTVLDVQEHWLKWCAADGSEGAADLRALRKGLASAKPAGLVAAAKDGERDLLKVLGGGGDMLASAQRFAEWMSAGAYFGLAGSREPPPIIVLSPTRADFIGLASFVGSLDDAGKRLLWVESLPGWSDFRHRGLQVLALEYGVSGQPDWTKGADMNARNEHGQLEHVAQKVSELLLEYYLVDRPDPWVVSGLSTNLVIELFGENNTRGSGSGGGSMVSGQSKFIPGGNSNGGQLRRRSAEGRFRQSKGRDHFVPVLRACQRQGADSAAKQKRGTRADITFFALLEAIGGDIPPLVQAPFLGKDCGVKEVPEGAKQDYFDFARAYQSAFAHWLQTKATGTDAGADTGALFLKLVGHAGASAEEVYGVPVSVKDLASDCLELRFLKWLATQK